jgi:Protein of unknown function (DUF3515)
MRTAHALAAMLVAAIAACSDDGATDLAAAPLASSPECAAVVDRAPQKVLDRGRAEAEAVGVAVWGDPPIVLQCGVELPAGPTSDPCYTIEGVDWLWNNPDDEEAPAAFVTYGRSPGVRVTVPGDRARASGALAELAGAVSPLPATKRCLGKDPDPTP